MATTTIMSSPMATPLPSSTICSPPNKPLHRSPLYQFPENGRELIAQNSIPSPLMMESPTDDSTCSVMMEKLGGEGLMRELSNSYEASSSFPLKPKFGFTGRDWKVGG
ncbi:hypothetical protein V6N13_036804 [Hibiscus sabdariffa]|uniref:Uncharacterized protein n=1 Tax=Hibiscus sabdariffa TaxID=183260 RepID=A0ABR2S5H9_9ROSI